MKPAVFLDRDGTIRGEVCRVHHIDRCVDLRAAYAVGAGGVLVLSGCGKGEHLSLRDRRSRQPDHVAEDLAHAVDWILSQPGAPP